MFPSWGVDGENQPQACHDISVPAREAKRRVRNRFVCKKNDAQKMARNTVKA